MIADILQNEDSLTISYTDKTGNIDFKHYNLPEIKSWYVSEGRGTKGVKNWDGRSVTRRKSKSFSKFGIRDFIEDLPQEDKDTILEYNMPKMYVVDIETEITEGFASPEKAENRILTFSIVTPNKQAIVLGLEDLGKGDIVSIEVENNEYFKEFGDDWKFSYFKFKSEEEMITAFLTKFVRKMPLMTGWNFIGYDWTYITNRCKRLGIDLSIASSEGRLTGGKGSSFRRPYHVAIMDYMELVRMYDRSIAVKENYSLEFIASASIGKGKIKYDGNLQELYETDFKKYTFYNIVDSILVYYIHKKLKCLDVHLTIAYIVGIPMQEASSPVSITETLLNRKIREDGNVVALDLNKDRSEKDTKYEGAFVKQPKVGYYEGVAGFDYASLYPSIMRSFNISPDSFEKKLPEDKDVIKEWRGKLTDKIITENGAVFDTKDSYLKVTLTDLYGQRKEYKKKSYEYAQIADKIKQELEKRF